MDCIQHIANEIGNKVTFAIINYSPLNIHLKLHFLSEGFLDKNVYTYTEYFWLWTPSMHVDFS